MQRTRAQLSPPAPGSSHGSRSGPAPWRGRPAGSLTVRAGRGPSLLALAKSSRLPARVRRAHALLPAPALCTERLPGRRKSTCHFLNCLQLVPLTDLGQTACARRCRAARPRLRELGGVVRAASRPGHPACRYEVQCAQPPVGGEWGGSRRASVRAAGCPVNPHGEPLMPRGPGK